MDSIGGQPPITLFSDRTTNPSLPTDVASDGADISSLRSGVKAGPTESRLDLDHASGGGAVTIPGPVVVWAADDEAFRDVAVLNSGEDIVVQPSAGFSEVLRHMPLYNRIELRGGGNPTGGGYTAKLRAINTTES